MGKWGESTISRNLEKSIASGGAKRKARDAQLDAAWEGAEERTEA